MEAVALGILFFATGALTFLLGRAKGYENGYNDGWQDRAAQFARGSEEDPWKARDVESFVEEVYDPEGLKVEPAPGVSVPVEEEPADITEADFEDE